MTSRNRSWWPSGQINYKTGAYADDVICGGDRESVWGVFRQYEMVKLSLVGLSTR